MAVQGDGEAWQALLARWGAKLCSNRAATIQLLPYMFHIPGVVNIIEFCDI